MASSSITSNSAPDPVQAGIEELRQWLCDRLQLGWANRPTQEEWALISAHMVDAKAPGLARRLRSLATLAQQGFPPRFFEELGELWLLIEGYENLASLPPALAQEVRSQLGQTQKKAQLQQRPGLEDLWVVVGQVRDAESTGATTLKRQRTWLWGQQQQCFALLLDYVHHRQSLPDDKPPGSSWRGELVFYDGALPQRALLKQPQAAPTPNLNLTSYPQIQQGLNAYAEALAQNPWCDRIPLSLSQILPLNAGTQLGDNSGQTLPLSPDFQQGWQLMALSGGQPLTLFGEWDGCSYLPLAELSSERWVSFTPSWSSPAPT
ncbi:MAG: hypothetical protein EA395_07375 [Phormidium sp. GEM2.Bin31]|nr:hypothetical protein [Phormidium sp. BM_Day4_Bin.17]TVR11665.1 MAG: hypothetical protein EA395_07375 [Phormidium sp. GEM2.Bin31]UCJ12573.1 MAG: hypothetical protein JWS08_01740 [Phormidium sp. PBR-2020]